MKLFDEKNQRIGNKEGSTDSTLFDRRVINVSPNHSNDTHERDSVNF
jgi:hypothetical protein